MEKEKKTIFIKLALQEINMAQDAEKNKKDNFDVYNYVFSLEDEVRKAEKEKTYLREKAFLLEKEVAKLRKELSDLKRPPLVMGIVADVLDNGEIIVKSWNGNEFLIKTPNHIKEISIGTRVALNQRTMNIVKVFGGNYDHRIKALEVIERPKITLNEIGGLKKVINELEEIVILPLIKPDLFKKIGIDLPKGILLHGLPGTGKTLLAKAMANKAKATFISVTGSELVRKYIGEGAGLVRNLFKMAEDKKPAIIFIDEIDAIASSRMDLGTGGEREVQRTLMQLLAELDGFKERKDVVVMGATNRIDILDPAILRPGRFDRIVEVPLPDEKGRTEIFKIHTRKMKLGKDVDLEKLGQITKNKTGADIKNICTEAGLNAIREDRITVSFRDFTKAIDKLEKKEDAGNEKMFW